MTNPLLWLTLSMALAGSAASAAPAERRATLSVPAESLVFDGPGLQPPDAQGHFAIGIKLPQPGIRAAHCESPNLILGMGTLNKPQAALTAADRKIILRNQARYGALQAAARHGGAVSIHVRNRPAYISIANGAVSAPYCTLSIDESLP